MPTEAPTRTPTTTPDPEPTREPNMDPDRLCPTQKEKITRTVEPLIP